MPRRTSKAARRRGVRSATQTARRGTNLRDRGRRRGLSFELLEDRRLLAVWDGGGGTSWHDPLNWTGDVLPAAGEDIVIGAAFSGAVIQITQPITVGALNSAASLSVLSGTLNVSAASVVSGAFALSGGTLSGAGDLTLTGESSWTHGTMLGSGKLIVAADAEFSLSGGSSKYLSRFLEIAGTASYNGQGLLFGALENTVGTINNVDGGVFTVTGESDFGIHWPHANHAFNNSGTFVHTGAGTTGLSGVQFHNNGGTVQIDEGRVQLVSGGSFSGESVLAAGTLQQTGGAIAIVDETLITGAGILEVAGGSFNVVGDASVDRLTLSSGQLTGSGALTITDQGLWTGGNMVGSGRTAIAADATLAISGAAIKRLSRSLENAGATTFDATSLDFGANEGAAGTINNLEGGVFTTVGEADINTFWSHASHAFNNAGSFIHAGSGTTLIGGVLFNVAGGSVQIDDGLVHLISGGSIAGESTLTGGTLRLSSGTLTASDGAALLGNGILEVTAGGILDVIGAVELGRMTQSGGTLTGTGDLTLLGDSAWTHGNMIGTGKITVAAEASLAISGVDTKLLSRILENAGATTYDGAALQFGADENKAGTINNLAGGEFTVVGESDIGSFWAHANHAFVNSGTFVHLAAGTSTFAGVRFQSIAGVHHVEEGLVQLELGGSFSGASVLTGQMRMITGLLTFAEGATITGDGALEVAGGSLSVAGTASLENLILSGGTLTGAGDLTLTGASSWNAGFMTGAGKTIVAADASLELSGVGVKHISRILQNSGSVTYAGQNLQYGALEGAVGTIDNLNGGMFTVEGEADVGSFWQHANHAFNNAGTFVRTGIGTTLFNGVKFNNNGGTIDVTQGLVQLVSGGSFGAESTLESGVLQVTGGTMTVADETTIVGAGVLEIAGGIVDIAGAVALDHLSISSGTLTGAGDLTLTGESSWTAGFMTGSGKTIVSSEASLALSGTGGKYLSRVLENAGVMTYAGGGLQYGALENAAGTISNLAGGMFTVEGEADAGSFWQHGSHAFNNAGTFVHTGAGTTLFNGVTFNNNGGTVQVDEGLVQLAAGGSFSGESILVSGTLQLTGGTVAVADQTSITGDGVLEVAGGSLTVAGAASLDRLTLSGGTLTGTGELTLMGESSWTSGYMTGTGKTIVAAEASLALSGTGGKYLSRVLENAGVMTYAGGGLQYGALENAAGTISNLAGGMFTVEGEADAGSFWQHGSHAFNNAGTFVRTGAGTTLFNGVTFNNNGGTVRIDAGTVTAAVGDSPIISGSNRLSIAQNATISLPGGLMGSTTNFAEFHPIGTLALKGGTFAGPSSIEAMSRNLGATLSGWSQNFAFGRLDLSGGFFRLVDNSDNFAGAGAEAVYVEQLSLASGSTLNLNGLHLYTGSAQILGVVQGGSVTVVPGATIPAPRVAFATTSQTVDEEAGIQSLTLSLAAPAPRELNVPLSILSEGTATAGVDYVLVTPEATFPIGATTAVVQVEIINDDAQELNEQLVLALAPVEGVRTGLIAQHTITIDDDDTPPGVYFDSRSQTLAEGGSGTITVRLEEPSAFDVTVPLVVTGTATSGVDYTLAATSIVIAAGNQSGSVNLSITDDSLGEAAENVIVRMGTVTNAIASTRPGAHLTHTATISANDKPSVSFAVASSGHQESDGTVQIEVQLSNASLNALVIPLSFIGSTVSTADFVSPGLPSSVTFAPQATTAFVTLNIQDDSAVEPSEALFMRLAATPDVALGKLAQHTFGIVDNERRLAQFTAKSQSVWEDAGTINATISIPFANATDIWFKVNVTGPRASGNYALRNQSPSSKNDFIIGNQLVATGQAIKISAGQTSVNVPISILNDALNEATERIVLTIDDSEFTTALGLPSNLGAQKSQTIEIKDNDPNITFSAPYTSVAEGNPPSPQMVIGPPTTLYYLQMTLSAPTNKNIVVPLSPVTTTGGRTISNGTATHGIDFFVNAPAIAIAAGKVTATYLVAYGMSDWLDESNETIVYKFGAPIGGGTLKSSSFTYTISDDDAAPYVYLATANSTLGEANKSKSVSVRLSRASAKDVYVPITFGGKAVRGSDYSVSGLDSSLRVKIPAGQTQATFTIKSINDSRYEGNESILVTLSKTPVNASLSSSKTSLTRTFTIVDDEVPPPKSQPTYGTGTLAIQDPPTFSGAAELGAAKFPPGAISISNVPNTNTIGTLAIANGILDGATLFFDANFNGVQDFLDVNGNGIQDADDPEELAAASLLNGMASIEIDPRFDLNGDSLITSDEGRWVIAGGVDTSTGLPWRIPMAAPVGMYTVTPLTTLQETLVRLHGFTVVDAEARVLEALGVEGATLATTSLPHAIIASDAGAAATYSQVVQLSSITLAIAELFAGAPAGLPLEFFADQAYGAVANRIAAPGSLLELTYDAVIADLIAGVARATGISLDDDPATEEAIAQGAAAILGQGNLAIAIIPQTGDAAFLTALTRVKKVMQGDATAALRDVTAGVADLADVVNEFTGANLDNRIAAATVGVLVPPSLVVSNASVVEGNSGQSMLEFTVEIIGEHDYAVSVDFATLDDELNPGGGSYVPISGTLNWAAGDVTLRTIQVPILGDAVFELDERVLLRLANATNVAVINEVGYGAVINDDALSIALPATGPNAVHLEHGPALLVLVNDEFIQNGPLATSLVASITGHDDVADVLTIDASAGVLHSDAIAFIAGGGAVMDEFRIRGGNFSAITHSFASATEGATTLLPVESDDSVSIDWQGVDAALLHVNDVGALTFAFGDGVTSVVLEDADPSDADPTLAGMMRIRSETGQFAPVVFDSSVGSLAIRGYFEFDDVIVSSTDPEFVAALNVVTESLSGDFNMDGHVGVDDLPIWQGNFGQSAPAGTIPGDGDGDRDVDGFDFLLWQRNLGLQAGGNANELLAATASPGSVEGAKGNSSTTAAPIDAYLTLAMFDAEVKISLVDKAVSNAARDSAYALLATQVTGQDQTPGRRATAERFIMRDVASEQLVDAGPNQESSSLFLSDYCDLDYDAGLSLDAHDLGELSIEQTRSWDRGSTESAILR